MVVYLLIPIVVVVVVVLLLVLLVINLFQRDNTVLPMNHPTLNYYPLKLSPNPTPAHID